MDALKALIETVDDDYLTGLCNKGTVKRAYKDLDQESPVLTWQKEEAQVALKEETCSIRMPLGESSCSCPSRSICRHIITAILWMKREMAGEEAAESEKSAEDTNESMSDSVEATTVFEELLQFPVDRLKRACGVRRYRQFIGHMYAGELPPIEESSIVTVVIPWEKATVKLLEPFAYSTCTCHSKELCAHKAQAVLAYQIEKGKVTLESLDTLQETETTVDILQVQQAGNSVCEEISLQLCTGLSRQSPEVSESLERLAVITHRAGLPDLESGLREAASEYQQYFARSAAFRSEVLLQKLLILFGKAKKLKDAKSNEAIRPLMGTFRDTYDPAGRLHLMGMGGRTFSSKTGYEGEIYYFLETQKKEWYTWTDARPVFYEGVRRRPPSISDNTLAPWGLNCSREQMQTLEFDLLNAKAASGGRLSVSQETKSEIIGTRSFVKDEVRQMVAWDYEKLLSEHFVGSIEKLKDKGIPLTAGRNRTTGRRERLALVGAVRWDKTSFDSIQQRFSWSIHDKMGRTLYISLKYSKEERLTINLLERLEQKLRKRKPEAIVFFGTLYMDEHGRLCLFPIEFFLKEAEQLLKLESDQEEIEAKQQENDSANIQEATKGQNAISENVLNVISQYHKEAIHQLSDLFASGLYSIQEDTILELSHFAKDGESLGLHLAGTEFGRIAELLQEKRHQMEFVPQPIVEAMGRLDAYLRACQEKLSYDMALFSMNETEAEVEEESYKE